GHAPSRSRPPHRLGHRARPSRALFPDPRVAPSHHRQQTPGLMVRCDVGVAGAQEETASRAWRMIRPGANRKRIVACALLITTALLAGCRQQLMATPNLYLRD